VTKDIEDFRTNKPRIHESLELTSLLFLDIETTGLYPERGAKITEVALLNRSEVVLSWFRNAKDPNEPYISELLPELTKLFGKGVIVGHNVKFDLKFIAYEMERYKKSGFSVRFIDTMDLSKKIINKIADYQLSSLLDQFNIAPDGELHSALVDAKATRALFWKLVEMGKLGKLSEMGIKQLNW